MTEYEANRTPFLESSKRPKQQARNEGNYNLGCHLTEDFQFVVSVPIASEVSKSRSARLLRFCSILIHGPGLSR